MHNNKPQTVFVRIEGHEKTIFDDKVQSQGHEVETESGGKHMCNGKNCGRHDTAGNTPTASLDTASHQGNKFKFDGKWYDLMGDFLIEKIGDDKGPWHTFINGQYLQVGGCQYQTQPNDYILWASASSRPSPLKLEVLSATHVDQETIFSVKNWETQGPVGSATVSWVQTDENGIADPVSSPTIYEVRTDENGIAKVTFKKKGTKRVRAEKDQWIRSNTLTVNVIQKEK